MKSFLTFLAIVLSLLPIASAQKIPDYLSGYKNCHQVKFSSIRIYRGEFGGEDTSFRITTIRKSTGKMGFEYLQDMCPDSTQRYRFYGQTCYWTGKPGMDSMPIPVKKAKRNPQFPSGTMLDYGPLSVLLAAEMKHAVKVKDSAGFSVWETKQKGYRHLLWISNISGWPVKLISESHDPVAGYSWEYNYLYQSIDGKDVSDQDSPLLGTVSDFNKGYRNWYYSTYVSPNRWKRTPAPAALDIKLPGGKVLKPGVKGKRYLLDFFYLSCGPCVMSMPEISQWRESLKADTNIVFVTIDAVDDSATLARFEKARGYGLLYCQNPKEVQAFFDVHAHPTFIILDEDFNLVHREEGFAKGETVRILAWRL